jgi:hypothetical protein
MICHKCLFKLDSAYDFRLQCLDTNTVLKKKLLTMTHVAEVKRYLNDVDSASCLSKVGTVLHNHSEECVYFCLYKDSNLCIILLNS